MKAVEGSKMAVFDVQEKYSSQFEELIKCLETDSDKWFTLSKCKELPEI